MAAPAADWAGLPHDLLVLIAKQKDDSNDYREFYSLSKGKVSRRLYLPEAKGRDCFPFDQTGWLLTQSLDGEEVNLLNPFSLTQIQLPNQFALMSLDDEYETEEEVVIEDYHTINKACLSANPSVTSDYVLVISYNTDINYLAFWLPGDINWTKFYLDGRFGAVSNMIYHKGLFYLVTWAAEIWIVDVQTPERRIESRLIYLNDNVDLFRQHSTQYYLVEVDNALLLVVRFCRRRSNPNDGVDTYKCEVYEVDETRAKLEKINNLGNSTIFLDLNGAILIDSTKFTGVKANHIYFMDDWVDQNYYLDCGAGAGKDTGVYNLEDGNIKFFDSGLSLSRICPPTWIIPSL